MGADDRDVAAARRLRGPLLRWYRRAKRDLPWRRTRDPYAIWVSEVMLQQTTVAAVIPYWRRFLERFPDAAALSAGRDDEVLALWSGLGYYRRARALRDGAIAVMERHGGRVPEDAAALMDLPGVGRYTAGAIASLAFGRETPVVDGNVKRVFSRLFALRARGAAGERAYWAIADALVRGSSPGDWNQALMELGATVCTPRAPRCGRCPVASACRARASGAQDEYPEPKRRAAVDLVAVAVAWIERRGRVLLERRHDHGPFRGAWDLPAALVGRGESADRAIARALRARHGLRIRPEQSILSAKHAILRSRLAIDVIEAAPMGRIPQRAALRFVEPGELGGVPISGATAKIVRRVLDQKRSHELRRGASSRASFPIGGRAKKAASNPAQ